MVFLENADAGLQYWVEALYYGRSPSEMEYGGMSGQTWHERMKMDRWWNHRFCRHEQENKQKQEHRVNESNINLSPEWCALVKLDFIFGVAGLFLGMIGRIVFFFFFLFTVIYFMSVVMDILVQIANAVSSKNNK